MSEMTVRPDLNPPLPPLCKGGSSRRFAALIPADPQPNVLSLSSRQKSARPDTRSSRIVETLHDLRAIWSQLPIWRWIMPAVGIGLILALAAGQLVPWFVGKYALTGKDFQEVLGPSLLAGAVLIASYFWLIERHFCRAWLLGPPIILLCREIHFSGTGTGVYVALLLMAASAVHYRCLLQPLWSCPALCGWWFGAVTWYILAVSVDSGVFKFLPGATWWCVNLEETLESGGHLAVLLGIVGSSTLRGRR